MKKIIVFLFLFATIITQAQPAKVGVIASSRTTVSVTYATISPTDKFFWDLSNGNLTGTKVAGFSSMARSNIGFTTGKHTVEITVGTMTSVTAIGLANSSSTLVQVPGQVAGCYAYWDGGDFFGTGAPASGSSWTSGDKLQLAFDGDAHTLKFYKGGVLQGTFTGLPTEEFFFCIGGQDNAPLSVLTVNTGQTAFTNSIAGYPDGWFN